MTESVVMAWLRSRLRAGLDEDKEITEQIKLLTERRERIRKLNASYIQILQEDKQNSDSGPVREIPVNAPAISTVKQDSASLTKNDLALWLLYQNKSLPITEVQKKAQQINPAFMPKHVYTVLWRLKRLGWVRKDEVTDKYSLTPEGLQEVERITKEISRQI